MEKSLRQKKFKLRPVFAEHVLSSVREGDWEAVGLVGRAPEPA